MKRVCSIVVALLISLFIYLFYRSEKTVVNELMILILSLDTFTAIKSTIVNTVLLPNTVIFSLPGGLWIYCATSLAKGFYLEIRNHRIQVAMVPILFAIVLEFCQFIHLTPGRFDVWDIVFYALFWLLAYYSFQSHAAQQNIASPFTLHSFICLACFLSVYLAHVSR